MTMRTTRSAVLRIAATILCAAGLAGPLRAAPAASNGQVGSGTPASCSAAALDQTVGEVQASGGGQITFSCGAAPHTIVVAAQMLITSTVSFEGGGLVTLSGGGSQRVYRVQGGQLSLFNLVVSHGNGLGATGGCILNHGGVLILNHTRVEDCFSGPTGWGGGIDSVGGTLHLAYSTLARNETRGDGGAIHTSTSTQVTIIDSHLYSNTALSSGGGIHTGGTLNLIGSLLEHNFAEDFGGGLYAEAGANVGITGSRFYSNTAEVDGGGIQSGGTLQMAHSTLEANQAEGDGAGLSVRGDAATVNLDHVSFLLNRAGNEGGAVYFDLGVTFNAHRSLVADNWAQLNGGGLYLIGQAAVLDRVVVRDNIAATGDGGGIAHATGSLFIQRSTLSGNAASASLATGGGLYSNGDSLTLENVTLSGNDGGQFGGGLYRDDATLMDLINVTLAHNSAGLGGGYYQASGTHYALRNTLLASNAGGNCYGPNGTTAASLSTDNTCSLGAGRSNVNASLGPLQPNGSAEGFVMDTHLPGPGSAALNNGTNVDCPTTDQRGALRPVGGTCDVGAVEAGAVLPWVFVPLSLR